MWWKTATRLTWYPDWHGKTKDKHTKARSKRWNQPIENWALRFWIAIWPQLWCTLPDLWEPTKRGYNRLGNPQLLSIPATAFSSTGHAVTVPWTNELTQKHQSPPLFVSSNAVHRTARSFNFILTLPSLPAEQSDYRTGHSVFSHTE